MLTGRTLRLSLVALFALLSACKKEDTPKEAVIDFGPGDGLSYRSSNNMPNGTQDPTDWTLDGPWNAREQALFQSLGLDVNGPARGSATISGAFPNPATTGVQFGYSIPGMAVQKIVIVDSNYRVITETSSANPSAGVQFIFDLTRNGFQKGQRYRLYYVLYNGTTLYYKGHGDIKVD